MICPSTAAGTPTFPKEGLAYGLVIGDFQLAAATSTGTPAATPAGGGATSTGRTTPPSGTCTRAAVMSTVETEATAVLAKPRPRPHPPPHPPCRLRTNRPPPHPERTPTPIADRPHP